MKQIVLALLSLCLALLGGCDKDISERPPEGANVFLTVPMLCQYPSLPTGCEATAAAMVLQFYGNRMTAETVASWLPCSEAFYYQEGVLHGPDPYESFVGDPFSEESYGCFAPVIAAAINERDLPLTATVVSGCSLDELCCYLDDGKPLLVWVTMEMREPTEGTAWILPDGTPFVWTAGEHCMVLVGYDKERYYFNDPRSGGVVLYERALCEERFEQLGKQAVCISKR